MLVSDLHARVTLFDKQNQVVTHLGYDQTGRTACWMALRFARSPSSGSRSLRASPRCLLRSGG